MGSLRLEASILPPPAAILTLLLSLLELVLPQLVLPDPVLELDLSSVLSLLVMLGTPPEAAAVFLRHSWICSVRGYGSFLSYDGVPVALRILNEKQMQYICVAYSGE